jgi:hypothetical protein
MWLLRFLTLGRLLFKKKITSIMVNQNSTPIPLLLPQLSMYQEHILAVKSRATSMQYIQENNVLKVITSLREGQRCLVCSTHCHSICHHNIVYNTIHCIGCRSTLTECPVKFSLPPAHPRVWTAYPEHGTLTLGLPFMTSERSLSLHHPRKN